MKKHTRQKSENYYGIGNEKIHERDIQARIDYVKIHYINLFDMVDQATNIYLLKRGTIFSLSKPTNNQYVALFIKYSFW